MNQFFDLLMSFLALIIPHIDYLNDIFFVKLISKGPVIYWSDRLGVYDINFRMSKFPL